MINGHGNNIYQFGESQIEVDFSSNIAFNNHSDEILAHLCDNISSLTNYPDPEAHRLRELIAERYNFEKEQVMVTNGSAEAFYLVAHLLSRSGLSRTLITTPSFSEYEDSCSLYEHTIEYIALNELLSSDLQMYNSVWLGAPNNPDGYRISMCEIRDIASKFPSTYFIVDRAYNELSSDEEEEHNMPCNVIIINSFTKAYGIPGLRLGYLVADSEVVEKLVTMRPPWSVNALSLIAGEYIIENQSELQLSTQELIAESLFLQQEIAKIEGFELTPSNCNFFLAKITNGKKARELQEYLVNNHKLLIRDASNFRGLSDCHIRVAAHRRTENNRLIEALRQWR